MRVRVVTLTVDNPNASVTADQIVRQRGYRNRFDDVFVGGWDTHPKAYARVQAAKLAFDRPIEGEWVSDHFGVVVDLEIAKGG